jgi:hypothetical protein
MDGDRMAARELTDEEVFGGAELSDADVFGGPPAAKPRLRMTGRGTAPTKAPERFDSVLQRPEIAQGFADAPDPRKNAEALFNALQNNPDAAKSPMYRAGAAALQEATTGQPNPVASTFRTARAAQLTGQQRQKAVIAAREQTDEAFGGPVGQAVAAPGRRLAAGVAQVVGGVASIPQLFGSNVGKETSDAANLMAAANMPEDPNIADEVLAGAGQILPMIGGASAVRALALPLLGERAATGLATTLSGAAGGALTGGQALGDLEARFDLTPAEKQRRALAASIFSALTSKYADHFLLPGADKAATGPLHAGARGFLAEGAQETLDQMGQNVATDKPLMEGALHAGLIGGLVGGGSRVSTEVGGAPYQLAQAIDADARAAANAPTPRSVWAPVDPRVAPPMALAPEPAPAAPAVPALPYDPAVKAGPDIMVADQQGNARPMTGPEFAAAEDARAQLQAKEMSDAEVGLTPDVRRAQEQRAITPESASEVKADPDLLKRLIASGWQPPKDTNVAPRETAQQGAPADAAAAQDRPPAAGQPVADGADRQNRASTGEPDAALNPDAKPDDVLGDFERLYQQDVKDTIRERLGMAPRAEEALDEKKDTGFLRFLRENGVSSDLASDIYGDHAGRANRALPGVFRKNGMQLDDLVVRAVERGFLTQVDVESALDNGGTNRLVELIQDQIRGKAPVSTEMAGDRAAEKAASRVTQELQQQASAIGFDISGMDDAQVSGALRRIERRRTEALARKDQFDAREEARLEREAIQNEPALTDQQLDALDGDWLAGNNVTLADAMAALGFDPTEIAHAAGQAESRQGAAEPARIAPGEAPRASAADEGGQGRPALESYSPAEVLDRQERAAQADRAEQRQRTEDENRARADAQREEFGLTGSDRPADANPDQNDLFSKSAEGKSTATTMRTELRERFGDIVDRLEKRGILKLWDSLDAYNDAGQASKLPADARGVQGMYSRGVAHLFGDGVEPGNAVAVFLHEVGEHASMKAMLGDRYADLVRRAYSLAHDGDEIAQAAMDRIPDDTPAKFYDSELLAYMIEETASREKPSTGMRAWLRDAIAAIRAWFYQTGFAKQLERYGAKMELSPKDIAALAVRAVRWQAEQGGEQQRAPAAQPAFSKAPPTESEAFKRWFGDSKVVDAEGKPLVVYHGTRGDFNEFDPLRTGTASDAGWYGAGFYFTPDPLTASSYAASRDADSIGFERMRDGSADAGANVMAAYLQLRNPYDWRSENTRGLHQNDPATSMRKRAELEAQGHDGVLVYRDFIQLPEGGSLSDEQWQTLSAASPGVKMLGRDTVTKLFQDREWTYRELEQAYGVDVAHAMLASRSRRVLMEAVVFRPEQIKSAIGNRGEFDPENPDIRFSKKPPVSATGSNPFAGQQFGPQPWTVAEPGTWDNVVRQMQNNKVDLKRVRDAIEQQFGRLPDAKDAYLSEELFHKKAAARVEKIQEQYEVPILAKLAVAQKNAGVTVHDLDLYLHARHAPERNAAMQAINPNTPNNTALSGMSDAEAAKVMADFQANGKASALATIAKDVDTLLADTRTALVADGLEEASTIQAWEAKYKHYVPLMRDIEDAPAKGSGYKVKGSESKRATGSDKAAVNILANIFTMAETAAIRAEKADVGRSLLEMAKSFPNADFWTVDTPPTKPRINPNTGLVERTAIDPNFKNAENVVVVKDHGRERFIVFNKNNERATQAARAMQNLDVAQVPKVIQYVGKGTRFFSSLLTQRNPEFWLTNFSRDLQAAGIQMNGTDAQGMQAKAASYLPKAMAGMRHVARKTGVQTQWARYAQELHDAGGTTGYIEVFANSDERMRSLQKEVDRMNQGTADPRRLARSMLEFIDDYNDVIENGVRLAVFQAAREAGVSTARAASIAKNVTVNFNRKGNSTQFVNSLYMFFNAGVQGNARMAQALATSRTVQGIVGGIAMLGFIMDVVNRALAGDDDETKRNRYDLINESVKSRNWIFWIPGHDQPVKVPMPQGYAIFANAGRLISDAIFRKDPRNAAEYGWAFASTVMDSFSPVGGFTSVGQMLAPTIFKPAVQLDDNKNAFGSPVYKPAEQGFGKVDPKPAYTRHFQATPDFWKAASKSLNDVTGGDKVKPGKINIEPDILRFIYTTMTGGPGRALDKTVDAVQAGARGEPVSAAQLPLVGRFYGGNDDRAKDAAYYTDLKRAEKAKTQFDYFNKNDRRDLALEVIKELGQGDVSKGRQVIAEYERAKKDDRVINRQLRQLAEQQDDGKDVTEKTSALKERKRSTHKRVLSSTGGSRESDEE